MDWIKVTIYTSAEGIEGVTGRLYQLGITGLEIEDEQDFLEFLENNKQYWDYVDEDLMKQKHTETKVSCYVSNDMNGNELLIAIRDSMKEMKDLDDDNSYGRLEVEIENTSTEDWANNWKKYFHPMEVGEKILIKPEWEELTEPTDRLVFNINPGMSFGTGSHYTTQLCIEANTRSSVPGIKMLDLGCGSGILSILSLMLGAKEAVAVDIDPNAVDTAYENAQMNNIGREHYKVLSGNVVTDKEIQDIISQDKYEVVAANIVADVIIGLAPKAREYMKEGGVFITSGIIEGRQDEVKEALEENGFEIVDIRNRKDWYSIICK